VALPLSPLPILLGRVVFVGASVALLALALSQRAWYPLLVLASGPVLHAINVAQWSPLVTAGSMLPGLGWLLACKPNLGLSLWLGSPDRATARRLALGVAAAFAVSLLVLPGWPRRLRRFSGEQPPPQPDRSAVRVGAAAGRRALA